MAQRRADEVSGHTISVVIPTHDRADLVGEAVSSVLNQTAPPFEVIVVDDASRDHTPSILEAFGDRISVIRSETNVERGAARNLGARAAQSELLAFLDSDDAWEPTKLEHQLADATPQVPSITALRYVGHDGRPTGRTYHPRPTSERELFVNNYCLGGPSSLILPREAFEEVDGFPEERPYQGSEDWMLLVRLLWAGWPLRVVDEPLIRYRLHPGGSTQHAENLERSMWSACLWFEQQRLGPPGLVSMRRSRVAAAIACAYLGESRWRDGRRWSRVALGEGGLWTRIHGAGRMLRSAARGLANRLQDKR